MSEYNKLLRMYKRDCERGVKTPRLVIDDLIQAHEATIKDLNALVNLQHVSIDRHITRNAELLATIAELKDVNKENIRLAFESVATIEAANKTIAELQEENKWISVDVKPKIEGRYAVSISSGGKSALHCASFINGRWKSDLVEYITHWKPITKPDREV